jgi:hypothetical protein
MPRLRHRYATFCIAAHHACICIDDLRAQVLCLYELPTCDPSTRGDAAGFIKLQELVPRALIIQRDNQPGRHLRRVLRIAVRARHPRRSALACAPGRTEVRRHTGMRFTYPINVVTTSALRRFRDRSGAGCARPGLTHDEAVAALSTPMALMPAPKSSTRLPIADG